MKNPKTAMLKSNEIIIKILYSKNTDGQGFGREYIQDLNGWHCCNSW